MYKVECVTVLSPQVNIKVPNTTCVFRASLKSTCVGSAVPSKKKKKKICTCHNESCSPQSSTLMDSAVAAEVRQVTAPSLAAGPGKPHYLPSSLERRNRRVGTPDSILSAWQPSPSCSSVCWIR